MPTVAPEAVAVWSSPASMPGRAPAGRPPWNSPGNMPGNIPGAWALAALVMSSETPRRFEPVPKIELPCMLGTLCAGAQAEKAEPVVPTLSMPALTNAECGAFDPKLGAQDTLG